MIAPHDSSPHRLLPRSDRFWPTAGGAADVVLGRPGPCEPRRWRRTKEQAGHLPMLIREHMLVHLDLAHASTGQELPRPLADEVEPDPATGVTEQGAT